jgi:glutamate transport system permease protein
MSVLYDVPGPKARRISLIASIIGGAAIFVGLIAIFLFLAQPRENAGGVAQPGIFDPSRWDLLLDRAFWRFIWRGILGTLQMAAVAAVGALIFGVILSMARTARLAIIRVPAIVVVEFFRGMPVLLMMLFILLVFSTGSYWAGVIALVVYNGAVIGEALRSGIGALPKGQRESGLAIGLTPLQVRFSIEYPQAFRLMLPIIIAQLVVLLKDTSLAFILGYNELINVGLRQGPTTFGAKYLFTLFFVVWAIYLIINMGLSWVARVVARRTARGGKPGRKGRKAERVIAQLGGAGVAGASDPLHDPRSATDYSSGYQPGAGIGGAGSADGGSGGDGSS